MLTNSVGFVTVDAELLEDNDDGETEAVAAESSSNVGLGEGCTDKVKMVDMFDVERPVEEVELGDQVVTTAGDVLEEAADDVEEGTEDAVGVEMVVEEELTLLLVMTDRVTLE